MTRLTLAADTKRQVRKKRRRFRTGGALSRAVLHQIDTCKIACSRVLVPSGRCSEHAFRLRHRPKVDAASSRAGLSA